MASSIDTEAGLFRSYKIHLIHLWNHIPRGDYHDKDGKSPVGQHIRVHILGTQLEEVKAVETTEKLFPTETSYTFILLLASLRHWYNIIARTTSHQLYLLATFLPTKKYKSVFIWKLQLIRNILYLFDVLLCAGTVVSMTHVRAQCLRIYYRDTVIASVEWSDGILGESMGGVRIKCFYANWIGFKKSKTVSKT